MNQVSTNYEPYLFEVVKKKSAFWTCLRPRKIPFRAFKQFITKVPHFRTLFLQKKPSILRKWASLVAPHTLFVPSFCRRATVTLGQPFLLSFRQERIRACDRVWKMLLHTRVTPWLAAVALCMCACVPLAMGYSTVTLDTATPKKGDWTFSAWGNGPPLESANWVWISLALCKRFRGTSLPATCVFRTERFKHLNPNRPNQLSLPHTQVVHVCWERGPMHLLWRTSLPPGNFI